MNIKDMNENCNYLKIFDHKLELKNQVKIFEYTLIGMDYNEINKQINIYCNSNHNASSQIRIYNSNLEYINSIGKSKQYYKEPVLKKIINKV